MGGAGGYSGALLCAIAPPAARSSSAPGPPAGRIAPSSSVSIAGSSSPPAPGSTPVPLLDNSQQSLQEFHGRFWELTPWLPGTAAAARPPAREHLQAAFAGLAALHRCLACESGVGVSPGLTLRRDTIRHLINGGFDTIEAAVARQAASPAEAAAAGKWLSLARSAAPRLADALDHASHSVLDLQPCLRDARPDHFLFEQSRLTGIVDFGAMGVDCVAGDLARLIGEWQGGDPAARACAQQAYEQVRPLSSIQADLITVFESSADLLIGERWLRWSYLEGRRFEDPQAVPKGLARGLKRLERLIRATTRAKLI